MKCSQKILDLEKIQDQLEFENGPCNFCNFFTEGISTQKMWRSLLVSSVSVHGKTLCFDNVLPGGWSDTIRRIFWPAVNQAPWSSMGL